MMLIITSRIEHYKTVEALRDAGVSQDGLEKLADADAFRSLGLDRRQALWEIPALHDRPEALFKGQPSESSKEAQVELPLMTPSEHVVHDYATTSLSIKAHPVSFVREKLRMLHILSTDEINAAKDEINVKVAGLVLVRQRPGTSGGVCFITIEDEQALATLSCSKTYLQPTVKKYCKHAC